MFGMSTPSAKIAGTLQESGLHAERRGRSNEPESRRIEYSPALKPSTGDFHSAAEVLECTYLTSVPASRNARASSPTRKRLTQKTGVDFRLPAPQDLEHIVVHAEELAHLICQAKFVQPTKSNISALTILARLVRL